MFIKTVKVNNFRNFKGIHTFHFKKLNLILGPIGTGKSTISRIAILFALYGDTDTSIASLVNKDSGTFAYVELLIDYNGQEISIKRETPTKLKIMVDNVEILTNAGISDKNKWIETKFGSLIYFKKFRMFDLKLGINLLEEGKVALRKTLASFHETLLNNIRQKLQDKKSLYEKFNKDQYLIFKHYPSTKRLLFLKQSRKQLQTRLNELSRQTSQKNQKRYEIGKIIATIESEMQKYTKECENLRFKATCLVCGSSISSDHQIALLRGYNAKIKASEERLHGLKLEEQQEYENYEEEQKSYQTCLKEVKTVDDWILKLESRFKQAEFKYTNADVIVATEAIKSLDNFYSLFLLNTVKNLEPVINSIIARLDFRIVFAIDAKNNLDFTLYKEDKEYQYKDLSSGQRLILTVAFQIALLLEKGDVGFIVADEGFSALDEASIRLLYELFDTLPFQIISIIHRIEKVRDNINVIRFEESV